MNELQTVVEAENEALRRGLPLSAVDTVERKERLQKSFRGLYRHILRQGAPPLARADVQYLHTLGLTLRGLAVENAIRLEAALQARQQRIDQVMAALRDRLSQDRPSYDKEPAAVRSLRPRLADPRSIDKIHDVDA